MPKKPLSRREWLAMACAAGLTIVTVAVSWRLGDRKYYLASVLLLLYFMFPFFLSFEHRRPQPRQLVTLAVLTALCTVSRVAFAAVPYCKPVIGMIMITGMAMGPAAGFMTGALTAIVSNMVFGQGAWTPWQMFAYGLAGFLAGVLCRMGVMSGEKRWRSAICAFLITLLAVGPVLDTCTLFTMATIVNTASAATIYLAGLPVNAVLALSTAATVFLLAKPMTEKLTRIQIKYGMIAE